MTRLVSALLVLAFPASSWAGEGEAGTEPLEARAESSWGEAIAKRFAGSQLFIQTSANLNVFVPDLQLTRNETVDTSLTFLPRFDLGAGLQLRGRIGLAYEFTNSDFTARTNEVLLSDTTLQLFYRKLPALPWGTRWQVAAQVSFPTSKISQAQTNIITPGVLAQAFHGFSDVLGGAVLLMATGAYSRPLYESTTPRTTEALPYTRQCFSVADVTCSRQSSGLANVRDNLTWSSILLGTWGAWSPAVFFRMSHQFPYAFRDLPGVEDDPAGGNDVRVLTTFAAWVDYSANSWLTLEVGYSMARNILSAQGDIGNPVFDEFQDMRLYLAANVGLDRFYRALSGQGGDASGVIRN